jgi:hypothetical protein
MAALENVYLSGWEYNRLLQATPTTPRVSAVPAATLWSGAHQFWLFKQVLCTSDSLQNERAASDALGWATGSILDDMVSEGIVRSIDWTKLPEEVARRLEATHRGLRSEFSEDVVRELIRGRDTAALEHIKDRLLIPLLEHYAARASGAPNSLSTWQRSGQRELAPTPPSSLNGLLSHLAAPLLPGLVVCNQPGTGLSPEILERQRAVQAAVEGPLISELVAGDGSFAGSEGYRPYLESLEQNRLAYGPISEQMLREYKVGREHLLKLRDVAAKHLWGPLHNEWLPALDAGELQPHAFEKQIESATKRGSILRLLESKPVRILVGALPTITLAGTIGPAGVALGADPNLIAGLGAVVGAVTESVRRTYTRTRPNSRGARRLAVFYQEAS